MNANLIEPNAQKSRSTRSRAMGLSFSLEDLETTLHYASWQRDGHQLSNFFQSERTRLAHFSLPNGLDHDSSLARGIQQGL